MPLPDPALLPDDPAVLKQLVVQLLAELQQAHARLERQEHHMHLLLKRIYGSTSEKFDPQQGMLFDAQSTEAEATPSTPASPPAADASPISSPASKNRDRHGRGRIPDNIERKEVTHDLSEAEKVAMGGPENLVELPAETSEQLDWRPSTLFVVVHVRKKYVRKEQLPESGLTLAEQNVAVARKPAEVIPGGLAGPGLMAQVIVCKGADHLPLHRLGGRGQAYALYYTACNSACLMVFLLHASPTTDRGSIFLMPSIMLPAAATAERRSSGLTTTVSGSSASCRSTCK